MYTQSLTLTYIYARIQTLHADTHTRTYSRTPTHAHTRTHHGYTATGQRRRIVTNLPGGFVGFVAHQHDGNVFSGCRGCGSSPCRGAQVLACLDGRDLLVDGFEVVERLSAQHREHQDEGVAYEERWACPDYLRVSRGDIGSRGYHVGKVQRTVNWLIS